MSLNQRNSAWSAEEEEYLLYLKQEEKIKKWTHISEEIAKKFPSSQKNSKQCRERYNNYTRFGEKNQVRKDLWPYEVQKSFIEAFLKYGSSWKTISDDLNNKSTQTKYSENALKNKFYSSLRKLTNTINNLNKKKKSSFYIKFESVQRLLSLRILTSGELYGCTNILQLELADKVLWLSQSSNSNITQDEAHEIAKGIRQFNIEVKIPINKRMRIFEYVGQQVPEEINFEMPNQLGSLLNINRSGVIKNEEMQQNIIENSILKQESLDKSKLTPKIEQMNEIVHILSRSSQQLPKIEN